LNFKRSFLGLPDDGEYTISFFALNDDYPQVYVGVKDVKFYCTSDKITFIKKDVFEANKMLTKLADIGPVTGFLRDALINYIPKITTNEVVQKEYLATNAINGRDDYRKYLIGDVSFADVSINNVIEQFAGSLAVATIIGYTGSTDKVDTVTINSGGSGTGTVSCGGISRTITWTTDESGTIDAFLLSEAAYFTGFTLTKTSSSTFTFTAADYDFESADISASFGTATTTTAFSAGTPVYGLGPTADWNSRGGSESKPLVEIIGDEIADQYSRPKQLVQMAIYDEGAAVSAFDVLCHYEDDLNKEGASNRTFVFNRGDFDVKNRRWMSDLVEII
jgi:hypothetical protein